MLARAQAFRTSVRNMSSIIQANTAYSSSCVMQPPSTLVTYDASPVNVLRSKAATELGTTFLFYWVGIDTFYKEI